MKQYLRVLPVLLLAMTLCACGCKHETWNEANCETPRTCAACGEIEGAPLGHSWFVATCETARTCEVCGKTEGEALGHNWAEADCETPKTCTVCGETEGEALGHSWVDANFDAPKTCINCGKTEGDALGTDTIKTYTCREITMFVPEDMTDVSGHGDFSTFTFALDSANLAIFGLNETFAEYPVLEEYTTKDYAELIIKIYSLNAAAAQRPGKDYHYIVYTAQTGVGEYTYLAGIFRNDQGFWMIQICAHTEDYNEQTFFAYMDSVKID